MKIKAGKKISEESQNLQLTNLTKLCLTAKIHLDYTISSNKKCLMSLAELVLPFDDTM